MLVHIFAHLRSIEGWDDGLRGELSEGWPKALMQHKKQIILSTNEKIMNKNVDFIIKVEYYIFYIFNSKQLIVKIIEMTRKKQSDEILFN